MGISRVAKNHIPVPEKATVSFETSATAHQVLHVKGPVGASSLTVHPLVHVTQEGEGILFRPVNDTQSANALTGTMAALFKNMLHGVAVGFEKALKLVGVGYRAKAESGGKKLVLTLGFSHPVEVEMPSDLTVETPSQTEIVVRGHNKAVVNQMAADIRAFRPPEPYKGKGVRYKDERVKQKEAKKK